MKFFLKILVSWSLVGSQAFAGSVADYKKDLKAFKSGIALERLAKPLVELPGPLGGVQKYFRDLSKSQGNLTFRDYSRLRQGYDKYYKLALEVAVDGDLSENDKFEILEALSDDLGESIEQLTKPYMDAKLPERVTPERDESAPAYMARWVGAKSLDAWSFVTRDLTTWLSFVDKEGDLSGRYWLKTMVSTWGNMKRSYFLKRTAKDLQGHYQSELKQAKKDNAYNAKLAALVNLIQEYHEREIEPVKYGFIHRNAGRFYLFMGYFYWYLFPTHDFVADLPPYWGERTKLTGIMSVAVGAAAWTMLYGTRRGNSGVGFFDVVRKVARQDERARASLPIESKQKTLCEKLLATTSKSY